MAVKLDKKPKNQPKWLIGIDEVGRGPLAGPFTLCALAVPFSGHKQYFKKLCPNIRDSKKLTEEKRNQWNKIIRDEMEKGNLSFALVSISASVIDQKGIGKVARLAVARALIKLMKLCTIPPDRCDVRLDGSLFAPTDFVLQKTIIKGDEREPVISLASIVAKVHRDKYMTRAAKKYSEYSFEVHKGYGTAQHRTALKKYGGSALHRKSFLTRIV